MVTLVTDRIASAAAAAAAAAMKYLGSSAILPAAAAAKFCCIQVVIASDYAVTIYTSTQLIGSVLYQYIVAYDTWLGSIVDIIMECKHVSKISKVYFS